MLDLDRLDRSGEYRLRDYIASAVDNMRNDLTDLDFMFGSPKNEFNLGDEELDEYLRLTIVAILDAGGIPWVLPEGSVASLDPAFEPADQFGSGKEEIALNIVRAWRERGPRDSGMGWGDPVLFAMNL